MAKAKANKPIHFIFLSYEVECRALCNFAYYAVPIEDKMNDGCYTGNDIGTFDVTKVTCKRCINNEFYKEALDKIKYPLFHWIEYV